MSSWPLQRAAVSLTAVPGLTATRSGVVVQQPTAAGDVGAWVTLMDSTPAAGCVHLSGGRRGADPIFYDLAIGGVGSEIVVLEGVVLSTTAFQAAQVNTPLPLVVPAGVRLAIRAANGGGSGGAPAEFAAAIVPPHPAFPATGRLITLGYTRASRTGVTVVGASGGGSWAQITASTPVALRAVYLSFTIDNALNNNGPNRPAVQLAIGAAGSEVLITPRLLYVVNEGTANMAMMGPFFVTVPAGERLAARIVWDTLFATTITTQLIVHGVP